VDLLCIGNIVDIPTYTVEPGYNRIQGTELKFYYNQKKTWTFFINIMYRYM
jgi:hypothetical protein